MSVRIVVKGEVVTACLEGEIDHHSAAEMRQEIDQSVADHHPTLLVLDFKNISFMDSSGIGLVMGRYKTVSEIGGELAIINTSPQIGKVMRLAGMERLAQIGMEETVYESKQ